MESSARFWVSTASRVVVRPSLWGTAVRQARRVARPGWWRRAPYLPLPDRDYVAFRLETQYGPEGAPEADDVVRYLEWCRAMERDARTEHHPSPPGGGRHPR